MNTGLLIAVGAAGGTLRGLIDAYNCVLTWQAARRLQRQCPDDTEPERGRPRFGDYFDPVADPVALMVHAVMGGGAAALFGMTGQISGVYATFAVGASAPVLLTQLAQLRFVSEAVAGPAQQPAGGVVTGLPQPAGEVGAEPPQPVGEAVAGAPQPAGAGAAGTATAAGAGPVNAPQAQAPSAAGPAHAPAPEEPRHTGGRPGPRPGGPPRRARPVTPPDAAGGQEEPA
ncbi:hypothetical protein [Streptomyces sp. NPDC052496]|uniref:hypothetical protein n=1 Tax=Streptomyces sp. NPDC052496 TaxID=3154951 RepID=UPI00342A010E